MSAGVQAWVRAREPKRGNSSFHVNRTKVPVTDSPSDQIAFLQRTVGNREVERLLKSGMSHAHLASGLSATRPIFQESVTTVPAGPLIETNLAGGQPKHSRSVAFGEMATLPAIVQEVLRSPGEPLSPVTRAFMEPRFRQSFADVRLHTDAKAAESACSVNARAFTVGQDVVFGEKSICSP